MADHILVMKNITKEFPGVKALDNVNLEVERGEIRRLVKGLMVESYLEDGAQPIGGGCYGQSITDPCLGWEKTERLILELAEQA